MPPMKSRVVVEGEQGFLVVYYLGDRPGPLRSKLGGERLDGSLSVGLILGLDDLLDGCLRSGMDTLFGQTIEDV